MPPPDAYDEKEVPFVPSFNVVVCGAVGPHDAGRVSAKLTGLLRDRLGRQRVWLLVPMGSGALGQAVLAWAEAQGRDRVGVESEPLVPDWPEAYVRRDMRLAGSAHAVLVFRKGGARCEWGRLVRLAGQVRAAVRVVELPADPLPGDAPLRI